ncbi:MAG: NTP transferase domain-containing protein [Candidatus Binatia bacterium]
MIAAIVLAAGESRRMGFPKSLLRVDGKSFVEQIVTALKATKVGPIIVVLGHNAEEIKSKIAHLPITVVINKHYAEGQLSSLTTAIRSLEVEKPEEKVDGILVHLVDHPFLKPSLINQLIDRFYESGKLIVLPRYKDRRGHPVIFSSQLFPELLGVPTDQGAKSVVHAHQKETLEIETDQEGVTVDIDTPEEYQQYVGRK